MSVGPKTEAALAALQGGGTIEDSVVESSPEPVEEDQAELEPVLEEAEEVAIQDETQEVVASEDVVEAGDESEPDSEQVEEIVVNGKKLKLDYSDRDAIRKYAKQAGGFRKMQVERDSYKSELTELKSDYTELKEFEQTIEGAFEDGGIDGLVRTVTGSQAEYDKWLEDKFDRMMAKRDATPEQLERIELQEKLENEKRERERLLREREKDAKSREEFAEKQEIAKLQKGMDRAFRKWQFSGKLGDQELEQSIDDMVWEKAKSEIAKIPDDQELTPRDYDDAMRKAANSFRKFAKKSGRDLAKSEIDSKKKLAASKAKVLASKGPAASDTNEEVKSRIKGGDIKGGFAAFLQGLQNTK